MFRGSIVALVTPFSDDQEVDFEAYGRLIDFQLESGTHGIVPCGCTGEAATLSHDEQKAIIRFTVERVSGRVPVIAGTGSNNTKEALGLTLHAKDVGADAALLITPYYNKPTPEGQVAHYRYIAEETGLPIMLYNVPGRTATKMSATTIAELSRVANIVSVKEACGSVEQVSEILSKCEINVMSGDDPLTLPMMSVGAAGVVSVAANVAPDRVAALCNAAHEDRWNDARDIHYELFPLFKALFVESNPIPVKAALAEMGLIKNVLRLPLTNLQRQNYVVIEPLIQKLAIS